MRNFQEEFITRHRDLITPEALKRKITIVGAGAIGSFVALSLAKMGFDDLTVIDFDTVDPENIGSQFYSTDSIGKKKVDALTEMVWNFTGKVIKPINQQLTEKDEISTDILICAVDNMGVRKFLAERSNFNWLIDPRMGAEYATMSAVKAMDTASYTNYLKTLFSDEEAVQERCTAKTTIYTVLLIAGQVVKAVKDIVMEQQPIESLDWSIKNNALLAWSGGQKL
jgi:molybdopterin/thiamine biosynthesis adenylyltransferase